MAIAHQWRFRMRIRRMAKLGLGLALLTAIAVSGIGINAVQAPKKIRILYTDDMMGNWKPCG
jgi:hypothetical protein